MVYSYYPGCTLKTKAKNLDEYGRFALSIFGIELAEIPDWQCCGGAFTSASDEIATKLSSIRALSAAKANNSPIVTLCSACFNVIKQVNYQIKTDSSFAKKANNYLSEKMLKQVQHDKCQVQHDKCQVQHDKCQVQHDKCQVQHDKCQVQTDKCQVQTDNSQVQNDKCSSSQANTYSEFYNGETEVLHYLEILRDKVGFDAIAKKVDENPNNPLKDKKIGAYYGCLLLRPSKVMQFDNAENPKVVEELIKAIGAIPVVYPMRNECCGSYATIEDKSIANKKSALIVESGQNAGAEMLITACPLCLYNLQNCSVECGVERKKKPAIHYFTTILAASLGNEKASAELGLL